jgi:hypothetical protein
MQILNAARLCFLAALLAAGITAAEARTNGQATQDSDPPGEAAHGQPSQPDASGDQIFSALVKHNELRSAQLQEYTAVRTYSVKDLSGKVHASETVRMKYVAPDKKTFVAIAEEGSGLVRHMVLNRLIESESSAAAGKEHHDSSITPANYTFTMLGEEDLGAHHCYVVEALPKRKDKYLFEGKVWIDSGEFAIVRIAGHPAKKLSFWITRADFVRQYEKFGDFWLPAKDETMVDVRLYGKKILLIEHHIDTVNGVMNTAATAQNPSAADFHEKPLAQ